MAFILLQLFVLASFVLFDGAGAVRNVGDLLLRVDLAPADGRQRNIEANRRLVEHHNSRKDTGYRLSLNGPFAQLSWEEFQSRVLMQAQDCSATTRSSAPPKELYHQVMSNAPAHFDWRDAGIVSPVKSQGHCGSCWTFSTTGALEAHHAIKYGTWRSPTLSEQQLVDCASDFHNAGCSGGLPSHAFEYIHYAGGLAQEFFYPYEAVNNTCRFNNQTVGATTLHAFNITQGDEDEIQYHLLRHGPVSIAFQVAPDFRLYESGVYESTVCKGGAMDVNHAVLVVGYGEDPVAGPYWIVKNSWSYQWGEEGYFRIAKGKNMCGVGVCASYPIIG